MSEQRWLVRRPALDYAHQGVTVAAKTPEAAACDVAESQVGWWAERGPAGDRMLDGLVLVVAPAHAPHTEQVEVRVRASLECVPVDSDGVPW